MKTDSVKERIITAAINLIEGCDSIENVTVRDIAANAGVGPGLINYHFQTKDNLVNLSVQRIIGNIISNFDKIYQNLNMAAYDKLRYLTKRMCTFIVTNPGISRVSILSDLTAGSSGDNSAQTIKAYYPVIRELYGSEKTDLEIYLLTQSLTATIQSVFLRSNILLENTRIDFYDPREREEFIDSLLAVIFKRE